MKKGSETQVSAESKSSTATPETPEMSHKTCPSCQATIPIYRGYVDWCECGWNLTPQEPKGKRNKFGEMYDSLYEKAGRKLGKKLYEQVVAEREVRKGQAFANLPALLVATVVHLVTLAIFAVGLYAIVVMGRQHVINYIWGVLCLLLAWHLLPRFGKMPKKTLSREKYPALYQLVDEISDVVGTSTVDAIAVNSEFNAAIGQVGWRRKKVLWIGLPLFAILDSQERVAILGHELGHGANGDPNRSFYLGSAISTLQRWYRLVYPQEGPGYVDRRLGMRAFMMIANWFLKGIAGIVYLVLMLLVHLTYQESQRAEYYADAVAAEVGGTAAKLSTLDKFHLDDLFVFTVQRLSLQKGLNFFTEFQARIDAMPEREKERIRRVELLEGSRLDGTHPPTGYRIRYLQERPQQVPTYKLSPLLAEQVEKELKSFHKSVQERLVDRSRGWLY